MAKADCGFNNRPDSLVLYGPTIAVQVGYDADFQPNGEGRPNLPTDQHPALVDTGAGECCIDSALAMELKLPIVDRQTLAGALGAGGVNMHLAQIYVPALDCTVVGMFAGVHLTAGGQPHSALIGRDFLRNFTMAYDGRTGAVTLSND